jgi:hypothetical protein
MTVRWPEVSSFHRRGAAESADEPAAQGRRPGRADDEAEPVLRMRVVREQSVGVGEQRLDALTGPAHGAHVHRFDADALHRPTRAVDHSTAHPPVLHQLDLQWLARGEIDPRRLPHRVTRQAGRARLDGEGVADAGVEREASVLVGADEAARLGDAQVGRRRCAALPPSRHVVWILLAASQQTEKRDAPAPSSSSRGRRS